MTMDVALYVVLAAEAKDRLQAGCASRRQSGVVHNLLAEKYGLLC